MNAAISAGVTFTTTIVFTGPPLAPSSVSAPRAAADPVTSADFFSDGPGASRPPRPKPFFLGGGSSFFASSFFVSPPPVSPAAPPVTVAISDCGVAV